MNKDEYIEIPEYLKNFPKNVQDFILDGEWEIRTEEIGIKYSLDDGQVDSLVNEVLYVLIGLKDPDSFENSLESEVRISNLLSNQIKEELEKRVFEYAFRKISEETPVNNIKSAQPEKETPKSNFDILDTQKEVNQNDDVEIRPEITPISETPEIEKAQKEPFVPTNTPKNFIDNTPTNLPGMEVEKKEEFVQKPINIPRFTAAKESLEEAPMTTEAKPDYSEMLKSKLNTQTVAPTEKDVKVETPRYTVDPYREPLD